MLKKEFHGEEKVVMVKLQNFGKEFETLNMESEETIQDYFSRVSILVKEIRTYGGLSRTYGFYSCQKKFIG